MKLDQVEAIGTFAIVGATGLVGQECLDILAEHKLRLPKIKLLASAASAGEMLDVGGASLVVEELTANSFKGVDVAFFSVPTDVTKTYVPKAVAAGALVVDDSSVYRMDPAVPLVVPEINGSLLRNFDGKIIANPNCSTIPVALCLKPLADKFGIERVVVSTYQSVSGAGKDAFQELSEQTVALLNGASSEAQVFPHRIAFNLLPQIGALAPNGNSEEEEKVGRELRKILGLPELRVSTTAVRVPTFCGHGASVNVELKRDFGSIEEVRELLDNADGLRVLDNPASHIYPTNVEAIGSDPAFVGRIRRDGSVKFGLNLWVIADNLRKGAALNVLQCLQTLYQYRSMS